MEYIVDDRGTLAHLRQAGARATIHRIRLAGPLADEQTEKALNESYFACGCQQGSFAVLATLLGSVLLGIGYEFDGVLMWWRIGLYLAGAALLGKLLGLAISRLRFRQIYRRLQAQLS
jgi:hypothetical protein